MKYHCILFRILKDAALTIRTLRKTRGSGEMHMRSRDSTNAQSKVVRSLMVLKEV